MGLLDFIYYNSLGLSFGLSLFVGLEYISDKNNFSKNIKSYIDSICYWSLDKVVSVKLFYDENFTDKYSKKNNEEKKVGCTTLVYENSGINKYKLQSETNFSIQQLPQRIFYLIKNNEKDLYLTGANYTNNIQIEDINELYVQQVNFINAELEIKDSIIDITQQLKKYCIQGNIINNDIINVIIVNHLEKEYTNDYTLHIMNNNFEMEKHDCNLSIII